MARRVITIVVDDIEGVGKYLTFCNLYNMIANVADALFKSEGMTVTEVSHAIPMVREDS